MSYVTGSYVSVQPYEYPRGVDRTLFNQVLRGIVQPAGPVTLDYVTGGLGSSTFEVTAVSTAGVATYSALLGVPLYSGQTVTLSTLTHNSGTYTISTVAPSSSTAGTFQLVNIYTNGLFVPIGTLTADTSQTANGVGQISFATPASVKQAATISAVTQSVTQSTLTYSALVGPQFKAGQQVTISGMTNAGNNGTFEVLGVEYTTYAVGHLIIYNPNGVASDSGTLAATVKVGSNSIYTTQPPTQVKFCVRRGIGLRVWMERCESDDSNLRHGYGSYRPPLGNRRCRHGRCRPIRFSDCLRSHLPLPSNSVVNLKPVGASAPTL